MNTLVFPANCKAFWLKLNEKHPLISQFLVFFILSNGATLLQMVLMPFLKSIFSGTELVQIPFQVMPVGHNLDGSDYYIFNYAAGPITNKGNGGGLAYFLAVQLAMAAAQVVNFFAQRRVTFKSTGSIRKAAFWYTLAYVIITLLAAAAQGLYKVPVYRLMIDSLGTSGETMADAITMIINAAISFWVFFPIFKVIFRSSK